MGLAQGNFERATASADHTLRRLQGDRVELSRLPNREILSMLHDLEQIGAALRIELMNRT